MISGKAVKSLKFPNRPRKRIKVEAVFEDVPTRKATDVCKEALDQMKSIVGVAERDYWRPKEKRKSALAKTTIQVVRER